VITGGDCVAAVVATTPPPAAAPPPATACAWMSVGARESERRARKGVMDNCMMVVW